MKTLGINKKIGFLEIEQPIESNCIEECLDCNVKLNFENRSGWEAFTSEGDTQPLCKSCDKKDRTLREKEK